MKEGKGRLFVVSAPSGTGKNTVVRHAMKRLPDIRRSVSWTTRRPRRGEKEGRDYEFVTETRFKNLIIKRGFIEWAKVFGEYYGTPFLNIRNAKKDGVDLFLIIDVQGASQIKSKVKGAVSIFLVPPGMKELEERLKKRGKESESEIRIRLKKARWEISKSGGYDYKIINDKLNAAVKQLVNIVKRIRQGNRHDRKK